MSKRRPSYTVKYGKGGGTINDRQTKFNATARAYSRTITLVVNVDNPSELAKSGAKLAKFLTEVDVPHGPFDVDVIVRVGLSAEESAPPIIEFIPYSAENEDGDDGETEVT